MSALQRDTTLSEIKTRLDASSYSDIRLSSHGHQPCFQLRVKWPMMASFAGLVFALSD